MRLRLWSWGRRRRLAAVAACLEEHGWTVERLTRKELFATYQWHAEINYSLAYRPPNKPAMGWAGYRQPTSGEGPPLPECFRELTR